MGKKTQESKYTLVQHSGYGYGGDSGFSLAVEPRSLSTKAELQRVEKAGGLVFDSYSAASDRGYDENYSPEVNGIYPRAHGRFAAAKVDGLCIYIPEVK